MDSLLLHDLDNPTNEPIELAHTSLPEGVLPEEYSTNYLKTYYPGSFRPSLQILNVEARPFTFTGLFSDRETRIPGYAERAAESLLELWAQGHRIELSWRGVRLTGILRRVALYHRDSREIAYEVEFDPTVLHHVIKGPDPGPSVRALNVQALRLLQEDLERAFEELPPDVRQPPPNSIPVTIHLDDPTPIPPVLFEQDPWLLFRIEMERIQRDLTTLLEFLGNEAMLNAADQARFLARITLNAANRARTFLIEWDDPDPVRELIYSNAVARALASLNSLRLGLMV